jgi:hypothetical protein
VAEELVQHEQWAVRRDRSPRRRPHRSPRQQGAVRGRVALHAKCLELFPRRTAIFDVGWGLIRRVEKPRSLEAAASPRVYLSCIILAHKAMQVAHSLLMRNAYLLAVNFALCLSLLARKLKKIPIRRMKAQDREITVRSETVRISENRLLLARSSDSSLVKMHVYVSGASALLQSRYPLP